MQIPFAELPDEAIVRLPQVKAMTGLGRTTIYDEIKKGLFPRQIKITRHAVGWPMGVIRAYVRDPLNWKPAASQVEG